MRRRWPRRGSVTNRWGDRRGRAYRALPRPTLGLVAERPGKPLQDLGAVKEKGHCNACGEQRQHEREQPGMTEPFTFSRRVMPPPPFHLQATRVAGNRRKGLGRRDGLRRLFQFGAHGSNRSAPKFSISNFRSKRKLFDFTLAIDPRTSDILLPLPCFPPSLPDGSS